jgi:PAS domain S-box-containing protein
MVEEKPFTKRRSVSYREIMASERVISSNDAEGTVGAPPREEASRSSVPFVAFTFDSDLNVSALPPDLPLQGAFWRALPLREQGETKLGESESTFHALFDSAPTGIVTTFVDPSGQRVIERANDALGKIFGRNPEEFVGRLVDDFMRPDDRQNDLATVASNALGSERPYLSERSFVRADGVFGWLQLHSILLADGRVLTHAIDVTDRRLAESDRQRQQRWLAGIAEIRQRVLDEASPEAILSLVVQYAHEIANAEFGAIGTPDPAEEALTFEFKHGNRPRFDRARLCLRPSIRAVLELRQTVVFVRPPDDLGDGIADEFGPTILAPLFPDREVPGALLLSRKPGREPFNETEVTLVESFVNQASVATELAQARAERQRRAVLDDRERIARKMQDVVIQRLFGAGISLQSVASVVPEGKPSEKVYAAIEEIDTAIRELREAIFRFHQSED